MTKPAPVTASMSEAVSNVGNSATQNVTSIHLTENCDADGINDINGISELNEINAPGRTFLAVLVLLLLVFGLPYSASTRGYDAAYCGLQVSLIGPVRRLQRAVA